MNLFKRKPKEETVSRAEHERAMARLSNINAGLVADIAASDKAAQIFQGQRDSLRQLLKAAEAENNRRAELVASMARRLSQIAAQATPGANATVKRMAAIARGEEPQPRDKQQAEVGA